MSAPVLTDFSDRISPMLVKELRQGMRARTFLTVFLALQVFLALILFSAAAASTSNSVGASISGTIFTFFSIAVLVVQPLRGTNALSSEVKGNTIDMMVLTRLSAARIVWGKWIALVSQSALLLVAIIPYLILRYFFGGMNLAAEIVALLLVFLTSMAITAITVGLSGCTSVIVRAVVPIIGLLALLWMLLVGMMFMAFGGGRMGGGPFDALTMDTTESRLGVATYALAVTYLGWNMLSMGTSLISPAAENHSFLRRLISLVLSILVLAAAGFGWIEHVELTILLVAVIGVPALFIALTDSSILVGPVVAPFARRGAIGRFVGWFFYPTWASGVFYALLLTVVALVTIPIAEIRTTRYLNIDKSEWVVILGLTGGLLFPAVFQSLFFRGEGQRLAQYLLILVASFVMLLILTMMADAMDSTAFLWIVGWNPLAFIAMLEVHTSDRDIILGGVLVVDLLLAAFLMVRAFMESRQCAAVVQETRNSLENQP